MCPGDAEETTQCEQISALLSRVGDKWTVLVVGVLGTGPMRFNALRRSVGDISQKMLATTLRNLERDGFVTRTVTPTNPPQVEYALTDLGAACSSPSGRSRNGRWRTPTASRRRAGPSPRGRAPAAPLRAPGARVFSGT